MGAPSQAAVREPLWVSRARAQESTEARTPPEAPDLEELEVYQERAQGQRQFQALKASFQVLVGARTQPQSCLRTAQHREYHRNQYRKSVRRTSRRKSMGATSHPPRKCLVPALIDNHTEVPRNKSAEMLLRRLRLREYRRKPLPLRNACWANAPHWRSRQSYQMHERCPQCLSRWETPRARNWSATAWEMRPSLAPLVPLRISLTGF
mmetsp:Transcript_43598/g.115139  ORF Transcript_43598/g.115139 Transcript_43598/m.115139 type:complete len:208 (-) Transcript_43598:21-644(-)